jgi:hypothetical protein
MGVHCMGMCLIDVYLTGVHLRGVYLMGVQVDADIGIAYLYCNFRQRHQRSDLLASL